MTTALVFLLLIGFAIYAINTNQKKKVEKFPSKWHNLLLKHVAFYDDLSPEEKQRFQNRMMTFLSEVDLESIGFELNDLDKVYIASSAVIPVFNFPEWHYRNLSTVLVYPDHFNEDLGFAQNDKDRKIGGLVGTGRFENQMILSRKALHEGFSPHSPKLNTGIHEFVHLIDKLDGSTDGVPEVLLQKPYVIPWLKIIHEKMEEINNNESDIRHYGGTNQAEFLAVAAEYFFEKPELMKKNHPDLYQMLEVCFQGK